MKKIVLLFFALIFNLIFSLSAFAENFYITSYDVNLDVQKNRDIVVTENIGVLFTRASHGIYRTIPTKSNLHYEDGTTVPFKAKIFNVNIDSPYSTNVSPVYTTFKIGNPERRITGPKRYKIRYTYSMGNDQIKGNDELYFNIIGTKWNTNIHNVKFRVTLPTPYEKLAQNTGFSLGREGTSGYDTNSLKYRITDNRVIEGRVYRVLAPGEGLTIRSLLPEDYFIKQINYFGKEAMCILMTILALIAFVMWFVFGRDEKVIPIVNFYPPKNRNSAEVGVEYRGSASQKEIVSLIMYLANKGYLEIEDDGVSFTLHKLKNYEEKNPYERRLMNVLFKDSDSVTAEDLRYSKQFYVNCLSIIASLNKIKTHLFDKNANSIEKMCILFVCVLGIFLSMLYVLGDYSFSMFLSPAAFVFIFPVVGVSVVTSVIYSLITTSQPLASKIATGLFITIWGSGFILLPLFAFIIPMCEDITENVPVLLYGFLCIVISIICLINMPKRNKQGRLALGHIEGFRKFLEVAEVRRIESLLAEDRNYASDILPFAYVLDVSDKILPVLESISLYTPPTWYRGNLNNRSFSRFTSIMAQVSSPSVENGGISRSSSGGSGFSGGGRSGGGGGGGGGGSW